ncbi:MAG: threonine--tRNA ligase [Gammaproteobacteria bacterium]
MDVKEQQDLEVLRHSCAHLLAQAVKQLYPKAQITIGPSIENGFYYDIYYTEQFTNADLEVIEERMHKLAAANFPITKKILSRDEAIKIFSDLGEHYKVEIIKAIPETEQLSCYQQDDFIDLCRGPHVPSTGYIKAFKLMSLAGAYWRGDSKNEMLQRIYGTCWSSKKELEDYLFKLEEAEKRDHRKLAKKYDLFHMQEEAPGMVFWHPKGWIVFQIIENYIRNKIKNNYQEVRTPQIINRSLWEKSGHWDKFKENMFTIETDEHDFAIKPMNCPAHIQIFNQGIKSYRDLPVRLAEFGCCHRNEPSGSLHGAMRVRSFVQDDAHIFCTEDQIGTEAKNFIDLLFSVYKDFGFENNIIIKLATRPTKRIGSDEIWDKAEMYLRQALKEKNLNYEENPGEGSFYGPKLEFSLLDCLDRVWQCGTLQIDYSMPALLDANYVDEHSNRKNPVMLHRAVLGTLERFIAILIEHTAGNLPSWLAPVQVVVMNITDAQQQTVQNITKQLVDLGYRAKEDLRNEKIGFKIREHAVQRVPFMLVIGNKEVESGQVAVRTRDGDNLGNMSLVEFIDKLQYSINNKLG